MSGMEIFHTDSPIQLSDSGRTAGGNEYYCMWTSFTRSRQVSNSFSVRIWKCFSIHQPKIVVVLHFFMLLMNMRLNNSLNAFLKEKISWNVSPLTQIWSGPLSWVWFCSALEPSLWRRIWVCSAQHLSEQRLGQRGNQIPNSLPERPAVCSADPRHTELIRSLTLLFYLGIITDWL